VTVRHEGVLQAVLERGVAMEVIPVAALEGQTTSLGRGRDGLAGCCARAEVELRGGGRDGVVVCGLGWVCGGVWRVGSGGARGGCFSG
jgi:hypothetical protein